MLSITALETQPWSAVCTAFTTRSRDFRSESLITKYQSAVGGDSILLLCGTLTLRELDGTVAKEDVAVTLAEVGVGIYEGAAVGAFLLLEQVGEGTFDASLTTDETSTCAPGPVVYTGSGNVSKNGKNLDIFLSGMSDDCTFETLTVDLSEGWLAVLDDFRNWLIRETSGRKSK